MPETEVDTFAGIDVSARELSVALRRGKCEDKPAIAKFSNHHAGHKALIAHLFRGGRRVRVCLEASGNYSLDLALTLQAHRQVEISVINPRRARRFAESLGQRRILRVGANRAPGEAANGCTRPLLGVAPLSFKSEMHVTRSNSSCVALIL